MKIFLSVAIIFISALTIYAQYETLITVSKDGDGDYSSIQEALNNTKSFPDQTITIKVMNGVYCEKVRVYPWNTNIIIEGESADSTIIIHDDYFKKINKGRNSTFHTYTMSVEANDVTIRSMSIINSAGNVGQAIALSVSGDRCKFENCIILGFQDTLYCTGEGNRQYFVNCEIEGSTDYIFGNAVAVFEQCTLRSVRDSYITAASTTQNQTFGLVFINCDLVPGGNVRKVFLGRPWRPYAKTVFISCNYGPHILPKGWDFWNKESNKKSAYFAEFAPDVSLDDRVKWSHQLTETEIAGYTLEIIFGDWNYNQ